MPEISSEQPIYVLHQNKKRALFPKILSLLILGTIFYFGVLLNLRLLDLLGSEETTIKTVSLIIVGAIILLGIILSLIKSRRAYIFYQNRIMFGKKQVVYQQIINTVPTKNLSDKIFNTYSISLTKKFKIQNISQQIDLQSYVQQLIDYCKRR